MSVRGGCAPGHDSLVIDLASSVWTQRIGSERGESVKVSGMGPVPVQPGSVSTGIDPMRRGPASLEGPPSLLSQQPKRSL